jgi:hypothetical protein
MTSEALLLMSLIRKRRSRFVKYGVFTFTLGVLVLLASASQPWGALVFGVVLVLVGIGLMLQPMRAPEKHKVVRFIENQVDEVVSISELRLNNKRHVHTDTAFVLQLRDGGRAALNISADDEEQAREALMRAFPSVKISDDEATMLTPRMER